MPTKPGTRRVEDDTIEGNPSVLAMFAYGTVRAGQGNDWVWAELDGIDVIEGAYAHGLSLHAAQHAGFPYALEAPGDFVVGDLIIPQAPTTYDELLRRFDSLEGYRGLGQSNHYDRVVAQVTFPRSVGSDAAVEAWVYVAGMPGRVGPKIEGGDWLTFKRAGMGLR